MNLFVDSGAPSIYNIWARKKKTKGVMGSFMKNRIQGETDDYSFLQSDDYLEYKKDYIKFLVENKDSLDVYVNFDIINNAEATWANQLEMESYGLKPIPVFHIGEDFKWLKMILSKGYPYIALGGIIPNPVPIIQPILDNVWSDYLVDSKGYPKVKVHGFAVTSARLVTRYPWWSTDSTSASKIGIYGAILVPKKSRGEWNYNVTANGIFVSNKSSKQNEIDGRHINTLTSFEKETVLFYLKEIGVPLGRSSFKTESPDYQLKANERWVDTKQKTEVEIIEESGVCNQYTLRNKVNLLFYIGLQKAIPEWPWPFKKVNEGFDL